ncbi:Apple domain-containing protein [Heracleum sosnowskyi]|uniref:non-specific serine/threonine protein kinase n=1 Tax=Heracleum sosnowskyi TaxID=360622 RepID=A0AAD8HKK5_9APIA|nr:Apple domain-containing protein [Heracleum sosnowskyi]
MVQECIQQDCCVGTNREAPILDTSGVLRIDVNGNLQLVNGRNSTMWSSNSTKSAKNNPVVAQLMDSLNLVIRYENDTDPENYLWQSVDHPTDHILSGMKLGWDLSKGLERYLRSWKSVNDPSPGNYTFRMYLEGYPQMKVADDSTSTTSFRFGPWDGIQFSGVSFNIPDLNFDLKLIETDNEIYSKFDVNNNLRPVRFDLNPDGYIELLTWFDNFKNWTFSQYISVLYDECDPYGLCGAYGSCDITRARSGQSACECLGGFVPKSAENWKVANWSDGCVRAAQLTCGSGDGFQKIPNLKLPDTQTSWFNRSMNLADCEIECRKNCSCTAYSNVDIRQGGSGCMLWFGDLIDKRNYADNGLPFMLGLLLNQTLREFSGLGTLKPSNDGEAILGSCNSSEVLRAIHIGLLCVQPYPQDRPNMTYVVSMLDGENELPKPKQPGFFTDNRVQQGSEYQSQNSELSLTINELSITVLEPR